MGLAMLLRRLALLAALPLLLNGCALFESRADRAQQKLPNYKAGYSDGCASANAEGTDMRRDTEVRDDSLFSTDKAYRAGWRSGFGACRSTLGTSNTTLPDHQPGGGSNMNQ